MSEADAMVEAVRSWPRDEQIWWRSLLGVAPREALLVGFLALRFDARPQDTDGAPPPR